MCVEMYMCDLWKLFACVLYSNKKIRLNIINDPFINHSLIIFVFTFFAIVKWQFHSISFKKYVLRTYYVPGACLEACDIW